MTHVVHTFSDSERADVAIGNARCRLLCGRTSQQLEDVYLVCLGTLPPSAVSGRKLLIPTYLRRLLSEMRRHELTSTEVIGHQEASCLTEAVIASHGSRKGACP